MYVGPQSHVLSAAAAAMGAGARLLNVDQKVTLEDIFSFLVPLVRFPGSILVRQQMSVMRNV